MELSCVEDGGAIGGGNQVQLSSSGGVDGGPSSAMSNSQNDQTRWT